ncbi:hypothetical protein [Clostridium sporogenes]|uniref:hypothetical protein n=1 Tax=Clostridium sporogenes TaxID=1509 RepID=UPI0022386D5A|nr:hypothetical protein [Clostridium sporogenes]MCW6112171.1 hypothetical protein [Clostridium sporogenes]
MNIVEQIINELQEDSCELYYKKRDMLQKITLLENMIQESDELKGILKEELEAILN